MKDCDGEIVERQYSGRLVAEKGNESYKLMKSWLNKYMFM